MVKKGAGMTLSEAFYIALLGAAGSLIVTLITAGVQNRKWQTGEQQNIHADTASVLTETSLKIVNELRVDLAKLKQEVTELRVENEQLRNNLLELEDVRDWAERLTHQLKSVGLDPVPLKKRGE